MPNRIDSPEYWIEDFRPTADELEALYGHALETMMPFDIEELAAVLVRQRAGGIVDAQRARQEAS